MRVKPVPRSRDAPLSTGTRWITLADTDSDLTVPGYSRLIDSPDVANAVGMVADIISDATIWLMENTDEGDKLVFGRGRKVHLTTETFLVDAKTFESVTETIRLTASAGTSIKTPSFSLGGTGDGACASTFTGSLKTTGDVVAGTVSLQSHVHTGVQSGNGTTGQPQG